MSTAIYTETEVRDLPFDLPSDELIEQELHQLLNYPMAGSLVAALTPQPDCRCNYSAIGCQHTTTYYWGSCTPD